MAELLLFQMKAHTTLTAVISFFALVLFSCEKPGEPEEEPTPDNFDRAGLLHNLSANVIIPNYLDFKIQADSLVTAVSAFNSSPGTVSLAVLRNRFIYAYRSWMHASQFEYGPGADVLLSSSVNIFPADTTQINANITAGTYDLQTASNLDAKGFPAIDFLIYGKNYTDLQLVTLFTIDANANKRKAYLADVANDIKAKAEVVYNGWTAGNYAATFTGSTGNQIGSPLQLMVNQLNYDYEVLKTARIGIPLGKKSLGVPMPEKCEALYSGYSLELAKVHLDACENVYRGRTKSGVDGLGLDDYLESRGATYNGGSLNTAIITRFNEARTAMNNIPGELSDAVINNAALVDDLYNKLQALLVLLKTDLPSALSITITYTDGDGD